MADQIQLRGGTAAESAAFTGASREVTVDTTNNTLRVHDGSSAGGHLLAKQVDLTATQTAQTAGLTALGVSSGDTNLGTFSGGTLGSNLSVKQILQAIETLLETKQAALGTTTTHLGAFSGGTIADNQSVKQALQALETSLEAIDIDTDDLAALTGIAENTTNLGTFTGSTIADNVAVKTALQSLETATELRATIATPAFTGHAYAPEWRATGTGHLKLRAETGNDLNIYLADQETLQITRDPSTGNPKFTAKGGSGEFKFNQIADLNGGFKVGGTEITASATELNYVDGVTSNVQTQLDTIQADVNQNETDSDAAIAAETAARIAALLAERSQTVLDVATVQADVDQNETDADAAIALRATIDDPTFTTKIESPEFHSVGTGHLKFKGGGNDIIFYPQDTETLQITRSGTDCRFTSNGGTGTFKFNQTTNFAAGLTSVTANAGTNTTEVATTEFVQAAIAATIDGAPGALDTLNELAAALGDDANFSTTITNLINANETHIDNVATLSGVAKDSTNLGTFSGATITDSSTIKTALQELETKVEAVQADVDQNEADADAAIAANEVHIDNKATLLGLAKDSTHLGTFTGSTISDNQTIKAAIQALESATELRATIATPAFTGNLATLIGGATDPVVHRIQGGFPDVILRTNGGDVATNQNEGRLLFEDAGGGAVGAIKQTMLATAPMRFFTGGITASDEQMRINANGRVGIGSTNPQALLHVEGSAVLKADFPDLQFYSGGERRILFSDAGGSAEGGIKFASNTMKFFAGGIAGGNQIISIDADSVDIDQTLVLSDGLTLDSVALTTVQTSGESFADNDTSLMTSAAINDRIAAAAPSTTKADLDVDHLITLSGVSDAADDLGTFTGSTISDNVTIKAAIQAVETAVETKAASANSSLTGTTVAAALDISGDIDVDGTSNLDNVDIDGNTNFDGTITVTTVAGGTDYSEVALTSLSPSSFNQTYTRQSTGFVLDTGTAASGNALFHADSNYYYYVASTGSGANGRALIWSVEDNKWVVIFSMSANYTEGNVSNNAAVGSVFTDDVIATSQTQDGRSVPAASGDVTFTTTSASGLTNAADDTAAASAGVAVGQLYRNGSVVMIRVS